MDKTKHEIRQCFNKGSKLYNKYNSVQQQVADHLISLLDREAIQNSEMLLDLGCGNGFVSAKVQKIFSNNYIGVDIADGSLAEINTDIIKICADIEKLPIANNSIDFIFSNMAFQWLIDIENSFSNISNTLKREGVIAFAMPVEGSFDRFISNSQFSFNDFYSEIFIKSLLKSLNFNIIISEIKTHTLFFSNAVEALKSITKLGAGAVISKNKTNLSIMRKNIKLINTNFEGQKIPLDYKILFIIAQKN